ncbi:MAG: hypothetical protein DWQ44_04995 [Bacteroidetes bacterium]|nr:MAG: hypothetical protein DWQ33_11640 [Bacteroidota bacterium]REK00735.1 MAG: hypothetical protein DWQ39_11315 [Bacteroidota bacterium]REK34983.1 MAG: hypothetical protein DWQ44_04995 [Bacteroidota bacterium]REK48220.1 MAG: hypothetical protein DWQ48_10350 [Bacteroidota bacterium]
MAEALIKNSGKTNWYVITGGPSSGKTTLVNILKERGYRTTIEHARHYLQTKQEEGMSIAEIRGNKKLFQLKVLEMQIEQENALKAEEVVFLDRAIPDALAYYRFLDLEPDRILMEAITMVSYRKVFLLDLLPLKNDHIRTENSGEQQRIQNLLEEVYTSLHFPIIKVPVMSPHDRVDFILEHV